ncbi:MAG: hypothetical protein QOI73_1155 [Solirubrobacteraceae bacterium]|nr:hypothetical protein [Solirubrobacteraceae bacterium]
MPSRALTCRIVGAVCAVTILAAGAIGASPASATDMTTTTYYTLNVDQRLPSSPMYFLGTSARDHRSKPSIFLERYRSGAETQQWTPVYPDWPRSPQVTGDAPFLFCNPFSASDGIGCGFQGHADTAPVKFVNRFTGKCMTAVPVNADGTYSRGTRLVLSTCSADNVPRERQSWKARVGADPYTPLSNRSVPSGKRCLDATNFQSTPGKTIVTVRCLSPEPWNQRFRLLEVDKLTCRAYYPGTRCGLRSRPPGSS